MKESKIVLLYDSDMIGRNFPSEVLVATGFSSLYVLFHNTGVSLTIVKTHRRRYFLRIHIHTMMGVWKAFLYDGRQRVKENETK